MSKKKIKISIQEIVEDFEKLVRNDERLDTLFDNKVAQDENIDEFYKEIKGLMEKYLPDYKDKMSPESLSDEVPTYDKALTLYKILYENFKEIFYQLV